MRKYLVLFILVFNFIFPAEEKGKTAISIDLGWSTEGLSNEGYGFGISIEQQIFSFLSIKFRHGVVETYKNRIGNRVDSFVNALLLSYNPFNKGIDSLSLAVGFGYDNILVSNPDNGETKYNFLLPFIDTYIGYKFTLFEKLLLEPYIEFLWPIGDVNKQKTGIAMDTTYVNIIGINVGVVF